MARGETVKAGPAPYQRGYSAWLASRGYSGSSRGRYKKILVDSADGNTYVAGGQQALDELIGFAAHTPELSGRYSRHGRRFGDISTAGDFIDFVFNKSTAKSIHRVDCPEGCHISRLEYSERFQLLRAHFSNNGSIVVYLDVPANVYATLEKLALDKVMTTDTFDGEERHAVGVKFWDLVRIRGTTHGNRYPAVYSDNRSRGTGYGFRASAASAKDRKSMTLPLIENGKDVTSDERLKALKENPYRPLDFLYRKQELTPSELTDIRRKAADLEDLQGTVAFELTHGDPETRIERARARAEKMVHDFLELPKISESLKKDLRREGQPDKFDTSEADPLLRQERFLVKLNMWPLP